MRKVTQQSITEKKKSACGKWVTTRYLGRDSSGLQVHLESTQLLISSDLSPFITLHSFLCQASSTCLQRTLSYEALPNLFQAVLEYQPKTLGDLHPDTESCPWALSALMRMFAGLIGGLKEAASKGIPHRQVDWDAIYCSQDCLKLGRFYPVTKDNTELYAHYSGQKPRFLSPEIRSSLERGQIDRQLDPHKADVYAVGVLFLQILLWSSLDTLDRDPESVYEVLRSVSGFRQFHTRIRLMLTPDPAQRPSFEALYELWTKPEPLLCAGCKRPLVGPGVSTQEGRFCEEDCYARTKHQGRVSCTMCGSNLKLSSELSQRICKNCKKQEFASMQLPPNPVFKPSPPAIRPQAPLAPQPQVPPVLQPKTPAIFQTSPPVFQPKTPAVFQTSPAVFQAPQAPPPVLQPKTPVVFQAPQAPPPVLQPRALQAFQPRASQAIQHVCVVCWQSFVAPGQSPHPSHSSEVVDFCSDTCKELWVNSEQEWDFGRHIPDNAQFCMRCGMVPVPSQAIGLTCNPLHLFCSQNCLSLYQNEQANKGQLVCPSCGAPFGFSLVCTGCGVSGQMPNLSCGHPYCARCFALCTTARCVRCGPLPRP